MDDPNQPTLPAWAPRSKTQEVPFEDLPSGSEKIWERARGAEPTRPPTPRAVIKKMYGTGPRGGLNTKAAAADLGVSQRTVQKWVQARKTPHSTAGSKLHANFKTWQNRDPRGRKSVLGRKRKEKLRDAPRFSFTGTLKISNDIRKRTGMDVIITQDARGIWHQVIDHLEAGNDREAHAALEKVVEESGDWGGDLHLKIDDLVC